MRHFTSDFIGALTAPVVPSELDSPVTLRHLGSSQNCLIFREMLVTLFTGHSTIKICAMTTFYSDTSIKPGKSCT